MYFLCYFYYNYYCQNYCMLMFGYYLIDYNY